MNLCVGQGPVGGNIDLLAARDDNVHSTSGGLVADPDARVFTLGTFPHNRRAVCTRRLSNPELVAAGLERSVVDRRARKSGCDGDGRGVGGVVSRARLDKGKGEERNDGSQSELHFSGRVYVDEQWVGKNATGCSFSQVALLIREENGESLSEDEAIIYMILEDEEDCEPSQGASARPRLPKLCYAINMYV